MWDGRFVDQDFLIREADGYLDLVQSLSDRFPVQQSTSDRIADKVLERIDKLGPSYRSRPDALLIEGNALRLKQQFAEAIVVLEQSCELEPKNLGVYISLAWCQKRNDQLDDAINTLKRALVVDELEPTIAYNLSCYYSLKQDVSQAVDYIALALALEPAFRNLIGDEPDFDPVRDNPTFLEAISVIC
ncbi:MAG TPA: hypothetical protein DHW38_04985 [Planctomycetaceae bacterium]|jgi:Flp pilus assembly protein TadD|nr:tetratricopeptide repeat protein [Pirellulales bacterium]HCK70913.1 hypothetical protein [Planctomycetaceae bacterium]|tara:strand:- start:762 stop:1325 length:564 start_codon:yes stop_codon:yes gene_type:complete